MTYRHTQATKAKRGIMIHKEDVNKVSTAIGISTKEIVRVLI